MPYIILTAHGEELDRKALVDALTVGRSPACDLSVRDILLSRTHCRIEPCGQGGRWSIVDLGSKNGTHLHWTRISEHTLSDGDSFRIGRIRLTFHAGPFVSAPKGTVRMSKLVRPADPHEALCGTVRDFVYAEPDLAGEEFDASPSPERPRTPEAGSAAAGGTVLEEISSSWDSIVATASRPNRLARPMPRPIPNGMAGKFQVRRQAAADFSLQVSAAHVPFLEVVPTLPRRRKANVGLAIALTFGVCAATALVLISGWALSNG